MKRIMTFILLSLSFNTFASDSCFELDGTFRYKSFQHDCKLVSGEYLGQHLEWFPYNDFFKPAVGDMVVFESSCDKVNITHSKNPYHPEDGLKTFTYKRGREVKILTGADHYVSTRFSQGKDGTYQFRHYSHNVLGVLDGTTVRFKINKDGDLNVTLLDYFNPRFLGLRVGEKTDSKVECVLRKM